MVYPLIDIRRADIGVRKLVTALEQSVVDLAGEYDIEAAARADAPGVYVEGRKLASVGLRIRRGASFHGMALNVDVDLEPFSRINPCGYAQLEMTDLKRLGIELSLEETAEKLLPHFLAHLGM
jgi:lipoyl(octanoyl) transferase